MVEPEHTIKAVLFDLDNTLHDHSGAARHAMVLLYDRYRGLLDGTSFETFYELYIRNDSAFWNGLDMNEPPPSGLRYVRFEKTLDDCGTDTSAARDITEAYLDFYLTLIQPGEGVLTTLESLKKRGYVLGIVTNGFSRVQRSKIARLRIRNLFSAVVMPEHAGVMKPHPDIFRTALDSVGCTAGETVFVGDNYATDVTGASAAGIRAVWYNPGGGDPPEQNHLHERCITRIDELLTFL